MRIALALVAVTSVAHADPPKLPAHYAKLFDKDRELVYDVTYTGWDGDKIAEMEKKGINIPSPRWPRKTDKLVVKCKVARVEVFKSAIASEIKCDQDHQPYLRIAGVYVATKKGLYGGGLEFPKTESDLPTDADEPSILAAPKTWRKDTKDTQFGGRHYSGVRVASGEWCAFEGVAGGSHGHNGDSHLCYARGVLSSGLHDYGPELRIWKFRAR